MSIRQDSDNLHHLHHSQPRSSQCLWQRGRRYVSAVWISRVMSDTSCLQEHYKSVGKASALTRGLFDPMSNKNDMTMASVRSRIRTPVESAVALRTENCWKLKVTPNPRPYFLVQITTEFDDDCGLLRAGTAAWSQKLAEN